MTPVGHEEERPDIYEYFGSYTPYDARKLLDAFVEHEIEFTLNMDARGLEGVLPFGGTFGNGVRLHIGVHRGDWDEALEICLRVF